MGIITLLTDFGAHDEYVGVMKGVILSIHPGAVLVDICHQVGRHEVAQAGFMLNAAYRYFPRGAVHLVVVDPGVGGRRGAVAFSAGGHFFVGPDNGVFSNVLSETAADEIVRLENSAFFRSPPSRTFHGRDIFAPVAARLAAGLALSRLGPRLGSGQLTQRRPAVPEIGDDGQVNGHIVAVDHFGNLITDIRPQDLDRLRLATGGPPTFLVAGHRVCGLCEAYEEGAARRPLAIVGSRGLVEIAVNRGSAREILQAEVGDPVAALPPGNGTDGHNAR